MLKSIGFGALAGGLGGAGLGYATGDKGKSKDAKARRMRSAIRGGTGGATIGLNLGILHGLHKNFNRSSGHYYHRRHAPPKGPTDHKPHLHHFGLSGNEKTKAEAIKKYREAAMKYHPDRPGGSESKMKDLNNAWDNIKSSRWFSKLGGAGFTLGFQLVT